MCQKTHGPAATTTCSHAIEPRSVSTAVDGPVDAEPGHADGRVQRDAEARS